VLTLPQICKDIKTCNNIIKGTEEQESKSCILLHVFVSGTLTIDRQVQLAVSYRGTAAHMDAMFSVSDCISSFISILIGLIEPVRCADKKSLTYLHY